MCFLSLKDLEWHHAAAEMHFMEKPMEIQAYLKETTYLQEQEEAATEMERGWGSTVQYMLQLNLQACWLIEERGW